MPRFADLGARRRPLDRQRGIALVAVLWITMLLAVVAASFASSTRTEGRLAFNLAENAKAEALADGAVHRAVKGLLEVDPKRVWRAGGRSRRLHYGDGRVTVRIDDEDAKIDLNNAPAEFLAGLLEAVGLEPEAAEVLADRIVDFRDEDDQPEPLGAEDPEYLAAGLAQGSADRPFVAVTELMQVLGMTEELFRRLRRHVTVFSGAEGIDPTRARRRVLRAVPGMTPELIEALRRLRPGADPFDLPDLDEDTLFDLELYFVPSREIMYGVRAEAHTKAGGVFVREAVIELSGSRERPFQIHDWHRGTLD
jgi:general secretion pathway protein K